VTLLVFLVTDKGEIKVFDMLSHDNTAEHFKLEPETYREAEWTTNNPKSLTITIRDTDSIIFKKARESILNMFPTRQVFLDKYFTKKLQLLMVKKNCWDIQYIDDPSETIQLAAVKENSYTLEYIENPTQKVEDYVNKHIS
jgi:hypothetical protein